jgi:hypothetical protein
MLNQKALAASVSAGPKTYVEDVFSTWLYTGNGSTQTITNGIDLSGKGGLVWFKQRNSASSHELVDTARGTGKGLDTRTTGAQSTSTDLTAFNSDGFSLGYNTGNANYNTGTFASWTFRKAAKFFDVVTYTGDGTSSRNISHALGSTPGLIIVKRTNTTSSWWCWHRSISTGDLSGNDLIVLNSTATKTNIGTLIGTASSTTFQVGGDSSVNASGSTYVAYLFAHDAGGFGDDGTESVIKCGSFTTDGSGNATVDLGWEPQWLLIKRTDSISNWLVYDNMRGVATGGDDYYLSPNLSDAEASHDRITFNATGFSIRSFFQSATLIYIAIRRGPMKTPTDATKVFAASATSSSGNFSVGFPTDFSIFMRRLTGGDGASPYATDRLRGGSVYLTTSSTSAEASQSGIVAFDVQNSFYNGYTGQSAIFWNFRRAPGFFDVVAYTGTDGLSRTLNHNLGVSPELLIFKSRNSTDQWWVSAPVALGLSNPSPALKLNTADAKANNNIVSAVSASTFTTPQQNDSGVTYIAYLFASCPGVSKVGSYTGTGTTLNIDCGFTAGARFVLIKRTDSTGDWFVWDTARGIVSGNDPYLLLNSTAAEVTSTDYIDPLSSGFQISSTAPAAINANGGTFIYLAIA